MSEAYFKEKAACCMSEDKIDRNLFDEFGVKRGLRDFNGKGVLTGLTNISKIESSKVVDGKSVPCDGQLWFRGYEINDLINGIGERGFEEVAYLLLMGRLPDREELDAFCKELNELRRLPQNFTRDVIMKAPGQDIMNSMTKSVLTLASYDEQVSDKCPPSVYVTDQCFPDAGGLWLPCLQSLRSGRQYVHTSARSESLHSGKHSLYAPSGSEIHGSGSTGSGYGPDSSHGARRRK